MWKGLEVAPASPEKTHTTEVREAKGPFPRVTQLVNGSNRTRIQLSSQTAHPPPSRSNRHLLATSEGLITQSGEEGPLCLWKLHTVSQFGVISQA